MSERVPEGNATVELAAETIPLPPRRGRLSAKLSGAVGHAVFVEVYVSTGLPGFAIVGLPDAAVRKARESCRAAVLSGGLLWPLRLVTWTLRRPGFKNGKPSVPKG